MIGRYRFARPCEIDSMRGKDVFVMTKDILELEIVLFAATVVLGVRASFGCALGMTLQPLVPS